ncbi:diguanylate cyclase domain-containing protein [Microvirga sp. KLBC 81]|uniref:diguanylate cyclase domain-containing protein n=1 Tax=Microvirga sp. KLBC 81 TaxID=1862707 RepID=UPI00352E7309
MEDAKDLAETVRRAFSAAGKAMLGPEAQVTVSVGCAASDRATTVKALLQEADLALYTAKDHGRDVVISASSPTAAQ